MHDLESEVIECHLIRFCKPMMQKTAYELWLKDQKTAMHLKCARFLEENAHRCSRCRSGDFVPYHHFAVDIRLNSLDLDTIRKMAKAQRFRSKPPSSLHGPRHPGERGGWGLAGRVRTWSLPRPRGAVAWGRGGAGVHAQNQSHRETPRQD